MTVMTDKPIVILFTLFLPFVVMLVVAISLAVVAIATPSHRPKTTDIHHQREVGPQRLV